MSEVWPLSWHDCYTVEESPTNVISAIFLHLKNESGNHIKVHHGENPTSVASAILQHLKQQILKIK